MSDFIARVAKQGFDADTASNNQLNFYETKPTFKIVKQMALPAGHALGIAHGLNYAPNFFAYADDGVNLWPNGSDDLIATVGNRNFMVGVDNTELLFDNNTQAKKVLVFSDIPNNTGFAEQATNENFVFEVWDGATPNRKVMSSMFNHLKEHYTGSVIVTSNHINNGSNNPVITITQGEYTHGLGFRPFVVVTAEGTYPFFQTDPHYPSAPDPVYAMPHNDIQRYESIDFFLPPGYSSRYLSLMYSIDSQKIKFYVKRVSYINPGIDFEGQELLVLQVYETFKFNFKVFYNDLDEIYSYLA